MTKTLRPIVLTLSCCAALLAGSTTTAEACLFPCFWNACRPTCCYPPPCAPSCCPAPCGPSCAPACGSCGYAPTGCSSCGGAGCSSCGSGGCGPGGCGVTAVPSFGAATAYYLAPQQYYAPVMVQTPPVAPMAVRPAPVAPQMVQPASNGPVARTIQPVRTVQAIRVTDNRPANDYSAPVKNAGWTVMTSSR